MTAPDSFVEQAFSLAEECCEAWRHFHDRHNESNWRASEQARAELRGALTRQAARCAQLEEANAKLSELVYEAPTFFAPQYDFEGRKGSWIKRADAARSVLSQKEQG